MLHTRIVKSTILIQRILPAFILFCLYSTSLAEEHSPSLSHKSQHHGHMQHNGGHHGAIAKGIEKFPTISYTEKKSAREIERPIMPKIHGDPTIGKQLATNKGRCLSCHILETDSEQPGDIGPGLSMYATYGRPREYTFQQIWDARAHNSKTLMPPLGTNGLLSPHEVMHIVAYLETLNTPAGAILRPQLDTPDYYVAGEDLTLADIYLEEGQSLFNKPGKNGQSCTSCHNANIDTTTAPSLNGIAVTYPKYDGALKKVMLLETRNNYCRQEYMQSHPYKLGSRASNTLSSYVKYLARNKPINVATDEPSKNALERGRQTFYQKTGQLNFSCADCHVHAAGKWLRGQSLSSIQPNGKHRYSAATWPRHYVALHDLGLISLQQRIRHCQIVTRTYPLPLGSTEYVDMELYITSLANGKNMQAPTKSKPRGAD